MPCQTQPFWRRSRSLLGGHANLLATPPRFQCYCSSLTMNNISIEFLKSTILQPSVSPKEVRDYDTGYELKRSAGFGGPFRVAAREIHLPTPNHSPCLRNNLETVDRLECIRSNSRRHLQWRTVAHEIRSDFTACRHSLRPDR